MHQQNLHPSCRNANTFFFCCILYQYTLNFHHPISLSIALVVPQKITSDCIFPITELYHHSHSSTNNLKIMLSSLKCQQKLCINLCLHYIFLFHFLIFRMPNYLIPLSNFFQFAYSFRIYENNHSALTFSYLSETITESGHFPKTPG